MGITIQATTGSSDAPDIEAGIYDARFDGIALEEHPEWAGKSKFGHDDDGRRFRWSFTLLEDGEVMYDEGDPVEVNGLTSLSMNVGSKTVPRSVKYLKALLTADEYVVFENGGGLDADKLVGRSCQVEVSVNPNGWPQIENVVPAAKKRHSAKAAAE